VLQMTTRQSKHLPELDGIRGLAILGVLCSHGVGLTGIFTGTGNSVVDSLFRHLMVPLWGGVDLFFALSGFLITGILLKTKGNQNYFSSFYARRALRIFPIYYLVLALCIFVSHFSASFARQLPPGPQWKFAYFVYLQNWPIFWQGQKIMGGFWGAYWSLAVEEQFYFIWPLVVLLLSETAISVVCLIGFLCALPLRLFLYVYYFGESFGLAQITSSRVDGLLLGAACAVYMFKHKKPVPMRWIVASGSLGSLIVAWIAIFHNSELVSTGKWILTFGITGFALLSGTVVALSQHYIPFIQRTLTLRWLRMAGKYSYGIYVYHLLIFLPVGRFFWLHPGLAANWNLAEQIFALLLVFTIVFFIAKFSYDLIETRFLRLKDRFRPRARITTTAPA
jgi:peptidoglycan/LPS O-acetylase OafA/YrhL